MRTLACIEHGAWSIKIQFLVVSREFLVIPAVIFRLETKNYKLKTKHS